MARMTIAQLRERAVLELAKRRNNEPLEEDIALAKKTMNSFYRLCGIDERLLYLENDERMHDSRYTKELEKKREKWFDRLNNVFKSEFDCCLVYFGYLPTICAKGTTQDLCLRYFYN